MRACVQTGERAPGLAMQKWLEWFSTVYHGLVPVADGVHAKESVNAVEGERCQYVMVKVNQNYREKVVTEMYTQLTTKLRRESIN